MKNICVFFVLIQTYANSSNKSFIKYDSFQYSFESNHPYRFAHCYYNIGSFYNNFDEPEKYLIAYSYFFRAKLLLEKNGLKYTKLHSRISSNIAGIYYCFGHFEYALQNYLSWYLNPNKHKVNLVSIYNTLGITLGKLGYHDYSLYIFQIGINEAKKTKNTIFYAIQSGNAGLVAFESGKLDLAKRLLNKDYIHSLKSKNYTSAANALLQITKIDYLTHPEKDLSAQISKCEELYRFNGDSLPVYFHEFASRYYEKAELESIISFLWFG
jgi:tetratricopeptide (TPR) repeat protein